MSDIGPFTATTHFALEYHKQNGPDIEVDVEISGHLFCNDPEWGIEARDITAKIIGRDLTEDEVDVLDLEQILTEQFCESDPVSPKIGEYYKSSDGFIWKVLDTVLGWGETRDRYVLIERPYYSLDLRGRETSRRRFVPLAEFAHGTNDEGHPLFEWTPNEKPKPDELVGQGG